MKDSSGSLVRKGTKAVLALALSVTLFLNGAYASSAVTLESPNPQHTGFFGQSVAISGTTVIVGANQETGGGYFQAGHAYIIDTTANALTITLTSPGAGIDGFFGLSVAVSGTTVVVGAPLEKEGLHAEAGHAYVFDATSGSLVWTLTSPNAQDSGNFGRSVAISGTTVVVGANREDAGVHLRAGQAYVFDATSGSLVSTLTSPNAEDFRNFGLSVAVSGTTVVVGAPTETAGGHPSAGNAYVFDAASGSLVSPLLTPSPTTGGDFGLSVAISGTTVVVGAIGEDAGGQGDGGNAYIFEATTGTRIRTLTSLSPQPGGHFGTSVAISGTTVAVGAPDETVSLQVLAGHTYTFDATTGTPIATLTSPYAQEVGEFGQSVAISECDPTVVVGAPQEYASGQLKAGHAYIFRSNT